MTCFDLSMEMDPVLRRTFSDTMHRALVPIWVVLLVITLVTRPSYAQNGASVEESEGPLRLMSYNIRFDNPAEEGSPIAWDARRDRVASVIRFHRPSILGTQEGLLHQLMDLEDRLQGYEWVGVGRRSGGGEFTAVFYRPDRVDLLAHDTFWLSATPNEPGSTGWDAALPRVATWARFRDRQNGDTLAVVNTHFDHAGPEARRKSARLIAEFVPPLAQQNPAVVMGDLNAEPGSPPINALLNADTDVTLLDAKTASEAPHHGPTSTFNNFRPEVLPERRIDYIFVTKSVEVRRHGHLSERWNGQFPSDHLPVFAEVLLGGEASD